MRELQWERESQERSNLITSTAIHGRHRREDVCAEARVRKKSIRENINKVALVQNTKHESFVLPRWRGLRLRRQVASSALVLQECWVSWRGDVLTSLTAMINPSDTPKLFSSNARDQIFEILSGRKSRDSKFNNLRLDLDCAVIEQIPECFENYIWNPNTSATEILNSKICMMFKL